MSTSLPAEIIYLACPYTDPNPEVRKKRFDVATRAAAHLIAQGKIVYSPITMTHPIDLVLAADGETLGSEYWVQFDEAFMHFCTKMLIVKIDGWDRSSGIRREVEWFKAHNRDVEFIDGEGF